MGSQLKRLTMYNEVKNLFEKGDPFPENQALVK